MNAPVPSSTQRKRTWTLIIGVALFLGIAVASYAILSTREDRGFLSFWSTARIPVPVIFDLAASDYLESGRRAVRSINDASGCQLLQEPTLNAIVTTTTATWPEVTIYGAITFRVDNKLGDDPGERDSWPHGSFIERGSAIIAAPFVLPPAAVYPDEARRVRVLGHEILHGLGHDPDHDDEEESLMYRKASGLSGATGQWVITEKDKARLHVFCQLRTGAATPL